MGCLISKILKKSKKKILISDNDTKIIFLQLTKKRLFLVKQKCNYSPTMNIFLKQLIKEDILIIYKIIYSVDNGDIIYSDKIRKSVDKRFERINKLFNIF
jgi:glutamate mutase epsilon subunit